MFALRPAVAADLAPIVALLDRCALPRADIERDFPGGFVVAELAERLVGVAGLETHGTSGLLRSLAVDGSHRGRGLARALTIDRLAWARSQRLADVWLLTTTAAALFARLGFTEAARARAPRELSESAEFARACPASATCMRIAL